MVNYNLLFYIQPNFEIAHRNLDIEISDWILDTTSTRLVSQNLQRFHLRRLFALLLRSP